MVMPAGPALDCRREALAHQTSQHPGPATTPSGPFDERLGFAPVSLGRSGDNAARVRQSANTCLLEG